MISRDQNHATMTGLGGKDMSEVLKPAKNPVPKHERNY